MILQPHASRVLNLPMMSVAADTKQSAGVNW